MTQKQQVIETMRNNGGFATFQQLNQIMDFSTWETKTPQASIRRIVQVNKEFFRVRPGLWALEECREAVYKKFDIQANNKKSEDTFSHSYYQGLIVELGNMRKYRTYVPSQDKNRKFLDQKLSEIVTEKELPSFASERISQRAKTVDVIWFNERIMPSGFYEVEHSTNITNSLDKFYELQDFRAKFYIVADESRHEQFNDYISRTLYKEIKPFVRFYNYENLVQLYDKQCALLEIEEL
ncbi:hypothetical protein [Butyrivibrio proteoclasticus]|uniref:hypothetical protein n=1 Tax=Butyrivibrio proteoclasticus TaxID=43305 RepID=UPI00047A61B8|nr:hypothetical protein [Butyrivibrio proteoclasticus]